MRIIFHGSRVEPFGLSIQEWVAAVQLGMAYGWQPAGTRPNVPYLKYAASPETDGEDLDLATREEVAEAVATWDAGNYTSAQHQIVTAEDAANLADGLEQGLARVLDVEVRSKLRRFATFCREGSFVISQPVGST